MRKSSRNYAAGTFVLLAPLEQMAWAGGWGNGGAGLGQWWGGAHEAPGRSQVGPGRSQGHLGGAGAFLGGAEACNLGDPWVTKNELGAPPGSNNLLPDSTPAIREQ